MSSQLVPVLVTDHGSECLAEPSHTTAPAASDTEISVPMPLATGDASVQMPAVSPYVREVDLCSNQGLQRRSTQPIKAPIWKKDYVQPVKEKATANSDLYPIPDVVSYSGLIITYQSFILKMSTDVESSSYYETAKNPRWVKAIRAEIEASEANQTSGIFVVGEENKL